MTDGLDNSGRLTRLPAAGALAALGAWAASLVMLWGWAFDASGGTMLVAMASTLSALALAALVTMAASRMLRAGGPTRLGVAIFVTFGLALVSTLAIVICAYIARGLAAAFLWRPIAWTIVQYVVMLLGMLPWAFGVAWIAGAAGDAEGTRREQISVWVRACGWGLVAFALAAWLGLHFLIIASLAMLALIASGCAAIIFRDRSAGPIRRVRGGAAPWPAGVQMLSAPAVAVVIGLVQVRLMSDGLGLSPWAGAGIVGAAAVVVAALVSRGTSVGGRTARRADLGAWVAIPAVAMLQAALSIAALGGGSAAWVCAILAIACEIPLVALLAGLLRRRWRVFELLGGGPRAGMFVCAAGAALGVLLYVIVASVHGFFVVMPLLGVGVGLWGVLVRFPARRLRRPWQWLVWSGVLLAAAGAAVPVVVQGVQGQTGHLTPGFWLTTVRLPMAGSDEPVEAGVLPIVRTWRSDRLTDAVYAVMKGRPAVKKGGADIQPPIRGHRGRWWLTRSSRLDFPSTRVPGVTVVESAADPAAVPVYRGGGRRVPTTRPASSPSTISVPWLERITAVRQGVWRDGLVPGGEASFLQAAHTGRSLERYDGAFLSALPADHPLAWRVYNTQTLNRWAMRVHVGVPGDRGGVLILRTQVGPDRMAAALAVARTFHDVVGDSWALADFHDGTMDLLLVGPRTAVGWHQWRASAMTVPTGRLVKDWPEVLPMTLGQPNRRPPSGGPGTGQMQSWFAQVAEK